MPLTVKSCIAVMEELAPAAYALKWDNPGLQLGELGSRIDKILITLTVTERLVQKAVAADVDLIISHHPLIFTPLNKIRTDLPLGSMIKNLLVNRISVYASHSNLDRAPFGLNYWLAEELKLKQHTILIEDELNNDIGLGRIGMIKPISLGNLVSQINLLWQTKVRYIGNINRICRKVAVCGGSGSECIDHAWIKNADVIITGDVKYHSALDAQGLGIAVIDAGHYATEKIMISKVAQFLKTKLPDVTIIERSEGDNPFKF